MDSPIFSPICTALRRLTISDSDHIILRKRILSTINSVIGFDEAAIYTTDPATILVTSAVGAKDYADLSPSFLNFLDTVRQSEYGEDDIYKIRDLATRKQPWGIMSQATESARQNSRRYQALKETGLTDELRCALMQGRECWGAVVLYRSGKTPYTPEQANAINALGPTLVQMIRFALLRVAIDQSAKLPEAPGAVILDDKGHIEMISETAKPWLDELGGGTTGPNAVLGIALDLKNSETGTAFSVVPGRSGCWIRMHASWLETDVQRKVIVVLEPAHGVELAEALARAYGLTERERQVTMWIARGLSSKEIAQEMNISAATVNDHTKSAFSKAGVQSRSQLISSLYLHHCLPMVIRSATPGPYGWFLDA